MKKTGFDNEKYLQEQSAAIWSAPRNLIINFIWSLVVSWIFDFHAARILPGFDPNVKIKLLQKLKDSIDIIICIYAGDIARKKIRADFGVSYDADTMRLIDDLRSYGLNAKAVIVTRYEEQPAVDGFINKLKRRDIDVYTHRAIKGYPTDLETIVSDERLWSQ